MMKKFCALLLSTCLLVLTLTACGTPAAAGEKTAKIQLKGNATTGYEWVVSQVGENVKVSAYEYKTDTSSGTEEMDGVGGVFTFTVEGVKEGSCEIVFDYVSPGEKKSEKTATYTATVAKDLTLTVKEK